jgi:hypothetical protein
VKRLSCFADRPQWSVCEMAAWYAPAAAFVARPPDEGIPAAVRRGDGTKRGASMAARARQVISRRRPQWSVCETAAWYAPAAALLARPADEGVPAAVRRGDGTKRGASMAARARQVISRRRPQWSVCETAAWYAPAAAFLARPADEGVPAAVHRGGGTQRGASMATSRTAWSFRSSREVT